MRKMEALVLIVAVSGLPSCGGSSSTTPTPTGPSQATITVTQTSVGQVCLSPAANANFRLRQPIRIAESAGLGANINFIRMSLLSAGGAELERNEVGSSLITSSLGTNRVAANGNVTATLSFDFNNSTFQTIRLDFNFTDDRGNVLQASLNPLNVTAILACTI